MNTIPLQDIVEQEHLELVTILGRTVPVEESEFKWLSVSADDLKTIRRIIHAYDERCEKEKRQQ